MSALIISRATKQYGSDEVVRNVSLKIEAGERIALLGHNGAGKTTLIKMILGLTPFEKGKIEVLGTAPGSKKARSSIGFLPESVAFQGALSGREQLHHFARLKSMTMGKADDLLERVGLGSAADRKIRTYSKGMRQRVGLAQAILGKPKLVLLDEPTSGLDPISRHEFYDIVKDLSEAGAAVLLSSHALTEMETRTDRIAILRKGRLVANDKISTLRQQAAMPIVVRVTTSAKKVEQVAGELGARRVNGKVVELTCLQNEKVATLSRITDLGDLIRDVEVTPASLEELYRHFSSIEQEVI
ncbi:MAG: ABC transporter ATP-binding protein [Devosiaceae bacterium]|nr:ABC transporter ATP-binding protein [Devosiaceae bacterium]